MAVRGSLRSKVSDRSLGKSHIHLQRRTFELSLSEFGEVKNQPHVDARRVSLMWMVTMWRTPLARCARKQLVIEVPFTAMAARANTLEGSSSCWKLRQSASGN
jgi:hypothetical protein